MSFQSLRDRILRLPKAHLHLHLFGGLSPELFFKACRRLHRPLVAFPQRYKSFAHFDSAYAAVVQIALQGASLQEILEDHVQQAHASGTLWTEISVSPRTLNDIDTLMELIQPYRDSLGIILLGDRQHPEEITAVAQLAARYANTGIVALGLAGAEASASPQDFAAGFQIAREAGLLISPHAGELTGARDVEMALRHLKPHRIAHGVWAAHDPALLKYLSQSQVCLDLSPISNLNIGGWSLAEYPLEALLKARVPCTLNADDPLLLGSSLLDEYELAHSQLGTSLQQLAHLASNSIQYSAAPPHLKRNAHLRIEQWLQDLVAEMSSV